MKKRLSFPSLWLYLPYYAACAVNLSCGYLILWMMSLLDKCSPIDTGLAVSAIGIIAVALLWFAFRRVIPQTSGVLLVLRGLFPAFCMPGIIIVIAFTANGDLLGNMGQAALLFLLASIFGTLISFAFMIVNILCLFWQRKRVRAVFRDDRKLVSVFDDTLVQDEKEYSKI